MAKHIHADLMMQYAQDAMETDKPWERWEIYNDAHNQWKQLLNPPAFSASCQYRRKPDVININGFEVHAPLRFQPNLGTACYSVFVNDSSLYEYSIWTDSDFDFELLRKGLVHLTKEAAIAHAKALLSFTEIKE